MRGVRVDPPGRLGHSVMQRGLQARNDQAIPVGRLATGRREEEPDQGRHLQANERSHGRLMRLGRIDPGSLGPASDDKSCRHLQQEGTADVEQIECGVGSCGALFREVLGQNREAQNGCSPRRCDQRPEEI